MKDISSLLQAQIPYSSMIGRESKSQSILLAMEPIEYGGMIVEIF